MAKIFISMVPPPPATPTNTVVAPVVVGTSSCRRSLPAPIFVPLVAILAFPLELVTEVRWFPLPFLIFGRTFLYRIGGGSSHTNVNLTFSRSPAVRQTNKGRQSDGYTQTCRGEITLFSMLQTYSVFPPSHQMVIVLSRLEPLGYLCD